MTKLIAFLLPLTIAACATSPEELATDDQASTVLDQCAVGNAPNASEGASATVSDTFTRKASTINSSCKCKQWQTVKNANGDSQSAADDAFPTCRPATVVDFSLSDNSSYDLAAAVTSWPDLTTGSLRETQCKNSTVLVRFEKYNHSTKQYDELENSGELHPQFIGNTCQPVGAGWKAIVTPGTEGDYRIRALGTIGIDADDHGYESITITAKPDDVISG